MIRKLWPALESPPPKPDKWAQFSDDQLMDLVCCHLGIKELTLLTTRDELILWLEHSARMKATQ